MLKPKENEAVITEWSVATNQYCHQIIDEDTGYCIDCWYSDSPKPYGDEEVDCKQFVC